MKRHIRLILVVLTLISSALAGAGVAAAYEWSDVHFCKYPYPAMPHNVPPGTIDREPISGTAFVCNGETGEWEVI